MTEAAPATTIEYAYRDQDGEVAACVVVELSGKRTRFLPRDGRWVEAPATAQLPPYRLDDLVAALTEKPKRFVLVVDTEAEADALWDVGIVATVFATVPPAAPFPDQWTRDFRGRRVVLVVREDRRGRALTLARVLEEIVAETRLLELAAGETVLDLLRFLDAEEVRQRILALPAHRPEYTPLAPAAAANGTGVKRFSICDVGQLVNEPDEQIDWLVEGLLPVGGLALVGAKPKAGKSTLVRTLVDAVATGRPFLGRPTRQGGVIYLAFEEKRAEVRRAFARYGTAGGSQVLVHIGQAPQDGLPALRELIDEHHPRLAVVDPLFKFRRIKDVRDYAEVSSALEALIEMARATSCTLVAAHHNTKAVAEGGDELLGSTAIFGAVDTAILITRRDNQVRSLYTIQRYGADLDKTVLQLDDSGRSELGSGLDEFERALTARRVLDALRAGPRTEPEVREDSRVDATRAGRVLRELVRQGAVVRTGSGKRGDAFAYSLPDNPPDWITGGPDGTA